MKKFEIINNKWIRVLPQNRPADYKSETCKIESINRIDILTINKTSAEEYAIYLYNGNYSPITINYITSQKDLAKSDFAFFEKLLFQ